jgi:peptidyl-prolyl cis-trans isomerase D
MALGFMRRHRKWLFGFLWLVIAAFIILYIPAFQGSGSGSSANDTLAQVGDETITVSEFQKAYQGQVRRLQQMNPQIDEAMLERLGIRERILASLVDERLVSLEARRLGLRVGDQELMNAISREPGFMGGGELRRRLALAGISEEEYTESRREELLRAKLVALVTDGVTVSPAEAERDFRRRNEQVKLEYVLVPETNFRSQVTVSDDEVKARFDSKRDAYKVPEKRVVSYLLVDPSALQGRAVVTDRDIQSYYEEHREEFREPEQVCARHVLIKVKTDPAAKEGHAEDEAKKIAQGVLDQAKAGADFAELAKKSSEDTGSASKGGDLGCFPHGQMVPEFDDAAFSLKPGELSDLVKTNYGFHVIRVESKKEESFPALSMVKDRIKGVLTSQRVRTLTDEKVQAIASTLRTGRSLEEAGRVEGVAVQKSAPVALGQTVAVIDSPAAVSRAFTLKQGETSPEPITVGRGTVFMSVAEIQPAHLPELKEVQEKVKSDLAAEKALALARARAQEVKAKADKEPLDKVASGFGLARRDTGSLVGRGQPLGELGTGPGLEETAYSLPEKTLSEPVRATGGWAVVRVLERKPFDPAAFEKEKASTMDSLREQKQQELFRAYLDQVRQRFPVARRADVMRRVLG